MQLNDKSLSSPARNGSRSAKVAASSWSLALPTPTLSLGAAAGASPRAPKSPQDVAALVLSGKSAISKEEADARAEILRLHHEQRAFVVQYEEKVARCAARAQRAAEAQRDSQLKAIQRAVHSLLVDEEPEGRARLKIREDRTRIALQHILIMELAVIACTERLNDLQRMEGYRRHFLTTFEEKERKQLLQEEGSKLWRPGIQMFGRCPFRHACDCPFRCGRCYDLLIDPHHLQDEDKATLASDSDGAIQPPSLLVAASPRSSSSPNRDRHPATRQT